jgi:DNA-binding SARP family transcriptional activator
MAIRLLTLGRFEAYADDAELDWLPSQRLRAALLVYLAVERHVSRDVLRALFWPDSNEKGARHALRQSLHHLRRGLGNGWVETHAHELRATSLLQCDAQSFESALGRRDWSAAAELYQGPFLDGVHLVDRQPWEAWVDSRRGHLARAFRRGCRDWVDERVANSDLSGAIAAARRWVAPDPLDDEAQHRLIQLLAMAGERTDAIRQYEAYLRLLEAEDLQPLDETVALIEQLRAASAGPGGSPALDRQVAREPSLSPSIEAPTPAMARRQLAAIMFTDIASFTVLMAADEQAAVAAMSRHRLAVESANAEHDGTLLQQFGDGSLSIFPSAVQAARAAVAIQQQLRSPPRTSHSHRDPSGARSPTTRMESMAIV